jgi:hypothetical protein
LVVPGPRCSRYILSLFHAARSAIMDQPVATRGGGGTGQKHLPEPTDDKRLEKKKM